MNNSYDILIPAYNAAHTLPVLLKQLVSLSPPARQILVVNDGSTDDTEQVLSKFSVHRITNESNKGKGFALRQGFQAFLTQSDSEYLICMDADLQHPASCIPDFLAQTQHDPAVVIGWRLRKPGQMPLPRIVSNSLTSFILTQITGQKILDSQCGFRMIRRPVLQQLQLSEDGFQLETEFILKAAARGFPIRFIPIPTIYNDHGSHINHLGDTLRFIKLVWNRITKK